MTLHVIYVKTSWHWTSISVPGSFSDYPAKQNFAMAPMQLSPVALQQQQQPPPPPPHHVNYSAHGSIHGNGQVLDYLENQVKGLDLGQPQMTHHGGQNILPLQPQMPPQPPAAVPFTPGPPSMLSALDDLGVRGVERRVITLPPIIQRVPSFSSRRGPGSSDRARGGPPVSSQSSGSTNRSGGGLPRNTRGYRDASPPRRGILRDYSDESDWENRRGRASHRDSRNGRGSRGGGSRPRARSRDDLMDELQSRAARRERSYSPPQRRRSSWSSDEDEGRKRKGGKGKDWPEKPPSYFSIENQRGHSNSRRNYHHLSVRPTHEYWHTVLTFPFPFTTL